jgi:hypothetical protein
MTNDLADIAYWQIARGWRKVNSEDTTICDGIGVGNNGVDRVASLRMNSHVAAERACNCGTRHIVLKLDIERPMIVVIVVRMADCLN